MGREGAAHAQNSGAAMRLALVGWCNDSGLGYEFRDALRHLPVDAAFVLPNAVKPMRREPLANVPHVIVKNGDLEGQMEAFIDRHRPDTVLTWEIPGSWEFPEIWARHGIRWVHVVHWDWFYPAKKDVWKKASALVAPNEMCRRNLAALGYTAHRIPVPIDTARFQFRPRTVAKSFLSICGFGGHGSRRGFRELFAAWRLIDSPPRLLIPAQRPPREAGQNMPAGVYVSSQDVKESADLYRDGDVLVQPSRFEGIGLPLLEAQACGMPVVTVEAEPMNEVAPDLTVPVDWVEEIELVGKKLPTHVVSVEALAETIRDLRGKKIESLSRLARIRIERNYSWNVLLKAWLAVLK